MPRYFVHVTSGDHRDVDTEGQYLASLDEAKAATLEGMTGILGDELRAGHGLVTVRAVIHDEAGRPLLSVNIRSEVAIALHDAEGVPGDREDRAAQGR